MTATLANLTSIGNKEHPCLRRSFESMEIAEKSTMPFRRILNGVEMEYIGQQTGDLILVVDRHIVVDRRADKFSWANLPAVNRRL